MAEVNQEVAVLLPILPLLLESRLGMTEDNFFRSTHTIDREGYQGDNDLRKVISTGVNNQLEDIDRNWIQHIYDYTTRSKYFKNEDHGGYAVSIGYFISMKDSEDQGYWKTGMNR